MTTEIDLWPPFALRVRSGTLDLSAIRDTDIPALVDLALAGIHEPGAMPFLQPWTQAPPAELTRSTAAYYWRSRADFGPAAWSLDLVVRDAGTIVGVQGMHAAHYAVTRVAETGSWLARTAQGRGIGTRMRQAVCALLFDHLGAVEVASAAFLDNPASLAVSRKVGYRDNGTSRVQRRTGEVAHNRRLLLTPEAFVRGADPVEVDGAATLRTYLGLDPAEG